MSRRKRKSFAKPKPAPKPATRLNHVPANGLRVGDKLQLEATGEFAPGLPDLDDVVLPPTGRPVRSHRHCPGCNGHNGVYRSFWSSVARALAAGLIVLGALQIAGLSLPSSRSAISLGMGIAAMAIFRPVWRDLGNMEDRRAHGGIR